MSATCKTEYLSVAEHKAMTGPVHVQVGYMGLTICSKVKTSNDTPIGGTFTLESPSFGTRTFPARLVRKCSGLDGRCLCAKETLK